LNTELVEYELLERRELFGTSDPSHVVINATEVAQVLARVVEEQRLYVEIRIKGRVSRHIRVEGWTLLGSMLGVFPVVVWSRPVEVNGSHVGGEARVEARTLDGRVVGAAESMVTRMEDRWQAADEYAIRSMAQTRAISKALRGPLGFVFSMAGYETTPAEELSHDHDTGATPGATPEPAEPGERPASEAQMRRMFALFNERGFDDRDYRLRFASQVIGRPIESARDLTMSEASQLMDAIEGLVPEPDDPFAGSA